MTIVQKLLVLPARDRPRLRLRDVADMLGSILEFITTLPGNSVAIVAKVSNVAAHAAFVQTGMHTDCACM